MNDNEKINGTLEKHNGIVNGGPNKVSLEREVYEAQDRATGLQVLWQNCKNDLVAARLDAASAHRQLSSERTKLRQVKDQVGELLAKVSSNEEIIASLRVDLKNSGMKVAELKEVVASKDVHLTVVNKEVLSLKQTIVDQRKENEKITKQFQDKCAEISRLNYELIIAKEELDSVNDKLNKWPHRWLSTCIHFHDYVLVKILYITNKLSYCSEYLKHLFKFN